MKRFAFLACLLLSGLGAQAQGNDPAASSKEPTGGLAGVALRPAELAPEAKREIRLLIDPQLSPQVYYPSAYDLPGKSPPKVLEADPVASFKTELSRLGAEAAIYLAYSFNHRVAFVKIVRFPTDKDAEVQWSQRQNGPDSKVVTVAGRQVLVIEGGQCLRPGLKATACMLECKTGRYWIRTAGSPMERDPGFQLVFKQLEKIEQAVDIAADGPVISVEIVAPQLSSGERRVTYRNSGTEWDRGAHFHAVVSNRSDKPQRIWQEWCSWGYFALSFEITDDTGKKWTAKKPGKAWTINYPDFWVLEPRESLVYEVDFADSNVWKGFPKPDGGSKIVVSMRAVFEIGSTADSLKHAVWTGRSVSEPRTVTFYRPNSNGK